jgi:exopolysaccharide transport family protein
VLKRLNPSVPEATEQTEDEAAGFDPRDALNFVWRQWKFIGGVTILAALIGALYLARQTPLYTATTQLLLDPNKEKVAGQDTIMSDAALDLPEIESQLAIIRSTVLLSRVVRKERLVNDPEFGVGPGGGGNGLLVAISVFFSRSHALSPNSQSSPIHSESNVDDALPEVVATANNLAAAVGVSRAGQAHVLDVSCTSADPNKAARLANAVADAYVVDKLDARFDAAKRASAWLSDRLVELREQLRNSEEAVNQFRIENNLQSGPGATLNQEQLAQMNGRLVSARADAAEKKARLELLQRIQSGGGNVSALPDVMNSGTIADLRKQENDLTRQEADLLTRYSDRHPSVVNVRAQIADVHRAMSAEIARLAANIKNEYELAKASENSVENTLREVTGQTDLDNSKAITLRELERTAAVNKTLFEDFLQRAKVTQEQSTFEARDSRILSAAQPPDGPSSPNTGRTMLLAMLLGLCAGAGGGFLIEKLNAGFTTPRQVEGLLEMPLLASISKMESRDLTSDGKILAIPQYPLVKPLSRFSEAFRSLRSAIQMSDVDNPPKVIQITSTIPGEGKSTIAMTTAASAAQSEQKVLVIDCDLRHPSISRYFGADEALGLVDYLVGKADLDKVIGYDEGLRLWFLPAGSKTQNPADLLGSEKLRSLIERFRTEFDLVLVDTPPMGLVVDPLILSHLVDKVVFVVRWASTAREMIAHSIQRLSGHRKVAGVVFNYVIDAQAQKYGKYAYYYYGGRYYKKYYSE